SAKLDSRRDFQVDMTLIDRLDLRCCTKDCLGRADLDGGFKIVTRPYETVMGLDIDFEEQITIGRSVIPCFTITFHTQAHAAVDPGRYMDGNFPLHPGVAGTMTFPADLFGDLALAAALGTGRHPDKLPEWRTGCLPHLAAAPAPGTDIQTLCLTAGTAAGSTRLRMHDLDLPVHSCNCVLKTDLDPHQEIGTGLGTGSPLTPAAKEIEDVAKAGEVGMETAVTLPPRSGIGAFRGIGEGLVTHVVILCLLLVVGENTIGFVDLLEFLFCTGFLADIRMIFSCEIPV